MFRLLILDAYPETGRTFLAGAGARPAGQLYVDALQALGTEVHCDIVYPADADRALPAGTALEAFDGAIWTGSNLTIMETERPEVSRQISLAQALFQAGVPQFGSCWAVQLATVAAGGGCARSPLGREFGVAQDIKPTREGAAHPMLVGRTASYTALTCHQDEVVRLPSGSTLLASNAFSKVQAATIEHGKGSFWAVQYHPEYDFAEVAALARGRRHELVAQGRFADDGEVDTWVNACDQIHLGARDPATVSTVQASSSSLEAEARQLELRNWLRSL